MLQLVVCAGPVQLRPVPRPAGPDNHQQLPAGHEHLDRDAGRRPPRDGSALRGRRGPTVQLRPSADVPTAARIDPRRRTSAYDPRPRAMATAPRGTVHVSEHEPTTRLVRQRAGLLRASAAELRGLHRPVRPGRQIPRPRRRVQPVPHRHWPLAPKAPNNRPAPRRGSGGASGAMLGGGGGSSGFVATVLARLGSAQLSMGENPTGRGRWSSATGSRPAGMAAPARTCPRTGPSLRTSASESERSSSAAAQGRS
jgi:hypothetical protein